MTTRSSLVAGCMMIVVILIVTGCKSTTTETSAPVALSPGEQAPVAKTAPSASCESLFLQWFGIADRIVDVDARTCEGQGDPFDYTDKHGMVSVRHGIGTARTSDDSTLQLAVYSPGGRHGSQGFTACIASENADDPAFVAAHQVICSRLPDKGYPDQRNEFSYRCAAGEFDKEFGTGRILAINFIPSGYQGEGRVEVLDVSDCAQVPLRN